MKFSTALGRLRITGLIEGISLLLLLFIAMPLKYLAGKPQMVTMVGWAHGVLFVAFMLAVLHVYILKKWPFKYLVMAFIAAFFPFGTFWFDRKLKKQQLQPEAQAV
jgi:integral membrane protein